MKKGAWDNIPWMRPEILKLEDGGRILRAIEKEQRVMRRLVTVWARVWDVWVQSM